MKHKIKIRIFTMSLGFFDYVFSDSVKASDIPKGTVAWSNLLVGRHSGIIVEAGKKPVFASVLKKSGQNPHIGRTYEAGFRTDIATYVPCDKNGNVVGKSEWAYMAEAYSGKSLDYYFLENNCHIFTALCTNAAPDDDHVREMRNQLEYGKYSIVPYKEKGASGSSFVDYMTNFDLIQKHLESLFGAIKWVRIES